MINNSIKIRYFSRRASSLSIKINLNVHVMSLIGGLADCVRLMPMSTHLQHIECLQQIFRLRSRNLSFGRWTRWFTLHVRAVQTARLGRYKKHKFLIVKILVRTILRLCFLYLFLKLTDGFGIFQNLSQHADKVLLFSSLVFRQTRKINLGSLS